MGRHVFAAIILALLIGCGEEPDYKGGKASGSKDEKTSADTDAKGDETDSQTVSSDHFDLRFFPDDFEFVFQMRVAEFWETPLMKTARALPQFQMISKSMQESGGFTPDEIELMAFAFRRSNGSEPEKHLPFPGLEKLGMAGMVSVTRFKTEVPRKMTEALEKENERRTSDGTHYYAMPGDEAFIFIPDAKTAVLAQSEAALLAAIKQGDKSADRPDVKQLAASDQVAIAFLPGASRKHIDKFLASITQKDAAVLKPLLNDLQHLTLGLSLTDGIALHVQLGYTNNNRATASQASIEQMLALMRTVFDSVKPGLPAELAETVSLVLTGVKPEVKEGIVKLDLELSGKVITQLQQSAPQLVGLFGRPTEPARNASPPPTLGPPVTASNTEKLPKGLQLQARAGYSARPGEDPITYDEVAHPVWVAIDLTGGPAARAVAFDNLVSTNVKSTPGPRLRREAVNDRGHRIVPNLFKRIDRSNKRLHPENGVRVVCQFGRPPMKLAQVDEFAGTVTLRVAGKSEEFTIPNITSFADKSIDTPELKDVRTRVSVGDDDVGVSFGGRVSIGDATVVDGDGTTIEEGVSVNIREFGGETDVSIRFASGKVMPTIGLRFTMHSELQDITIPFHFENLELPAPPPSDGFGYAAPWRLSTIQGTDKTGLFVDAQASWLRRDVQRDGKEYEKPLRIIVDVTGPAASHIAAIGKEAVTNVKTSDGTSLQAIPIDETQRHMGFRSTNSSDDDDEMIRDGARAVLDLVRPTTPPKELETVKGSLRVLRFDRQKTIRFDKAQLLIGKTLAHPDLTAAGLKLKFDDDGFSKSIVPEEGSPFALVGVNILDAKGHRFASDRGILGAPGRGQFDLDLELPKEFILEVTVNIGLKEQTIPFKFEKLPIPAP